MEKKPHFVFAGGGTGGHLFPGLAVADELRDMLPEAHITFFTTTRPLDRQLLANTGYQQVEQPVRPLRMHPLRLPGFWWAWRKSVAAARRFLTEHEVDGVLGLGGYAAGPAVVAGHALNRRTGVLNPDAIPGRANRYLARRCDFVALQWAASRQHFAGGTTCDVLGCPIRRVFREELDAASCRSQFDLVPDRPVLLVTGASQGARTINEAMALAWPEFVREFPDWQLLHLSGEADQDTARQAYADAGVAANVLSFTSEMAAALTAATVVITRAGASTLAELAAVGRPSILLPYPYHRDRHQHANARVLVDEGAAIMLEDERDPGRNVAGILLQLSRLAGDEALRTSMQAATKTLGRPKSAKEIATRLAAWSDKPHT